MKQETKYVKIIQLTFQYIIIKHFQAIEWCNIIKETAQNANKRETQHKEMEKTWRIAKEMSNLIIYCRSVAFNIERARINSVFYEMSSFPETKAEKLICSQENRFFLKYHKVSTPISSLVEIITLRKVSLYSCIN